ncbi:AAA family ATPase [Desulfobotulus mexicanus]|uniref:AAA family ATPase n=1 Tax=Desulfobotulus mexicanus TaxID=2586642 RepID=A0A5Q4VDQ8_9BACT|nr:AAA family ATPase [Desulfobotulus mexicanus]TYT75103.1 AAA family ATPase [Desulfobotulus mexicanus]
MIAGISIKNFRGIREIASLPLSRFHVLAGPNGAGKTSFLDAIDFVRDCLTQSPAAAVESRHIADFNDLTWMRQGGPIEIELWLDLGNHVPSLSESLIHYRLAIKPDPKLGVHVSDELLRQYSKNWLPPGKKTEFSPKVKPRRLLGKTAKGTDFYRREKGTYQDSFNFGLDKSALALTPPDEERYPTANAVRRFLMQGVRYIQLNSPAMRLPCPAMRPADLELDGTNLARAVGRLLGANGGSGPHWAERGSPVSNWAEHLRYALPDLVNIGWARRQADNAEYLMLRYNNGLEAPNWMLSDGTLRMLALTLPAFLPPQPALYMVEEPENGVHPKALEIILRSLSTVPDSQMLLATHSPFVVQQCGIAPLLCFSRDAEGTHITPGAEHPILRDWDGTPDLGIVFAAGVLE